MYWQSIFLWLRMPKPTVKSKEKTVKKWVEVTPGRSTYYETETPLAAEKWESETKLAASTFKTAVAAADIDKRFKGGVGRAGSAKFSRKVLSVGVSRYGPGIEAAETDYDTGVEWVLSEIAATEIPSRKPRGDIGNWDRSKKIGDALHKKRLARLGAGVSAS